MVTVVCAARPLPIPKVVEASAAVLYAWHPGIEGGRAIADLLFGDRNPSGKLPITLPRAAGQVPIYYCHKNGGRSVNGYYPFLPASADYVVAYQDEQSTPLFPFGFGLSYTTFTYSNFSLDRVEIPADGTVLASVDVVNTGERPGIEIAQCYIRDVVAQVTRPVRELKAFQRVALNPGQRERITFALGPEQLAFWNNEPRRVVEPGRFEVYIGANAYADLGGSFVVTGSAR
jgi:beta-glucosidase